MCAVSPRFQYFESSALPVVGEVRICSYVGSACALGCVGYECVICVCVCVTELECVWVDEHSPLKSQQRYLLLQSHSKKLILLHVKPFGLFFFTL